jgi:hypothetical protein
VISTRASPRKAAGRSALPLAWRDGATFGTMIVAALLFIVTPIGLLVVTGDLHILIPMAMGVSLCWPLTRLMMNNTHRDYTPDRLPEELLS